MVLIAHYVNSKAVVPAPRYPCSRSPGRYAVSGSFEKHQRDPDRELADHPINQGEMYG